MFGLDFLCLRPVPDCLVSQLAHFHNVVIGDSHVKGSHDESPLNLLKSDMSVPHLLDNLFHRESD